MTLLVSLAGRSEPVPPEHFLYPRSILALQLLGIETIGSPGWMRTEWRKCDLDQSALADWCEILAQARQSAAGTSLGTHEPFWSPDARIVFFGERHINTESPRFVRDRLRELYRSGFRVLALEMFNSTSQGDIDRFQNGEIDLRELMEIFSGEWGYQQGPYEELIAEADQLGFRLLALDQRRPADPDFSQDLIRRDRHMARILIDQLRSEPETGVVCYTGRLHAIKSFGTPATDEFGITITEIIRRALPEVHIQSFLLFGQKEASAWQSILRTIGGEAGSRILRVPRLRPFADGLIEMARPD